MSDIFLRIGNAKFSDASGIPRVTAEIRNSSLFILPSIEVSVLLYDKDENVFAVSKTIVDSLAPGEQAPVFFSWPNGISGTPFRVEILTKFDSFLTRLK